MSQLLKNMLLRVTRPTLGRTRLTPRGLAALVTESSVPPRSPDPISAQLTGAGDAGALLAAVQRHLPAMGAKHHLHALRCLFEMQKTDKTKANKGKLIKDPTFSLLCQNFKKHVRSLDVNEAIEATKVLTFLGVQVESLILQTLLQILRSEINTFNIRQIMFLDFLLSRFNTKNHLVDALKLALPLAFQVHLPNELDAKDVPLLRDMLAYCCTHNMPDKCINNVVTGLLLNDQTIDAQNAMSIVWSLCLINCTEQVFRTRAQLLHISFDILTQNIDELTYEEVLRTAAKIKGRILEKHPEYYHEQLMDAIANFVVKSDVEFEKGLLIARVLSRIAHTHLGLVEHICNQAEANGQILSEASINVILAFVNCLSNNNYTPPPEQWAALRRQISANPALDTKNLTLPWPKFCLELASLGHFEDKLLDKVFSKEYLDKYLSKDANMLDYMQLLTLHEAVNVFYSQKYKLPDEVLEKAKELYPTHSISAQIEECLGKAIGQPQCLVRNVVLSNGFVADVLMCMKNGYPIDLPRLSSDVKVPIEKLNLPPEGVVVCVLSFQAGCFSMNSSRLRGIFRLVLDVLSRRGVAAAPLRVSEWLQAPAHRRAPLLLRDLEHTCAVFGLGAKLCAGSV